MRKILFFTALITFFKLAIDFPINNFRNLTKEEDDNGVERQSCKRYKHFVGSNLFDANRKPCFTVNDLNLLVARKSFELMVPTELPDDLLDDKCVGMTLRYFYYGLFLLRRLDDCKVRHIMEKAFYDTLGGFLRYYLIPMCKFSFYSSKVNLKTVRNVVALYEKCRIFLNTNGNGWREPMKNPLTDLKAVRIKPLSFNDEDTCDAGGRFCTDLDLDGGGSSMEVVEEHMLVTLPKIECEDSDGFLSNIWIPFNRKRTYNLRSCKSSFIIVKFYISVSRCYKKKAMSQKIFDVKFRQWFVENIKMHLADEQLYPGLGGILNVYEYLRKGGRDGKCGATTENKDDETDELVTNTVASGIGYKELLQKFKTNDEIFSSDEKLEQTPDEFDDISTLIKRDIGEEMKQKEISKIDAPSDKSKEEEKLDAVAAGTGRKKIKKKRLRQKCKKKKKPGSGNKKDKCKPKYEKNVIKRFLKWILLAVAVVLFIFLFVGFFVFLKTKSGTQFKERFKRFFKRLSGKGGKAVPPPPSNQSDASSKGGKKGKKVKLTKAEKKAQKEAKKAAKAEAKKAKKAAKAAKKAGKKKGSVVAGGPADPKLDKKAAKAAKKAAAKAAKAAKKAEKQKLKKEKKEKKQKGRKGSAATSASETSLSIRRRGGGVTKSVAFRKRSRQRRLGRRSRSRSTSRSRSLTTKSNISSTQSQ